MRMVKNTLFGFNPEQNIILIYFQIKATIILIIKNGNKRFEPQYIYANIFNIGNRDQPKTMKKMQNSKRVWTSISFAENVLYHFTILKLFIFSLQIRKMIHKNDNVWLVHLICGTTVIIFEMIRKNME